MVLNNQKVMPTERQTGSRHYSRGWDRKDHRIKTQLTSEWRSEAMNERNKDVGS